MKNDDNNRKMFQKNLIQKNINIIKTIFFAIFYVNWNVTY